ncbi:MAG: Holliday junction resolvase RuvX [Dehalococcoidales bacterium]|nr:Holliday junction resolvase RuvX [Dehalococcoidales bacterium]
MVNIRDINSEVFTGRSLALDIGDRRIGVALSDPLGILATPLTIIERVDEETAIEAVMDIVSRNQVELIIVGLPRSMEGEIGAQAKKVQTFTENLRKHISIPLEFRDERLTTVSARRLMKEAKRTGERDDAIAAAFILQGYLDEASAQSEA